MNTYKIVYKDLETGFQSFILKAYHINQAIDMARDQLRGKKYIGIAVSQLQFKKWIRPITTNEDYDDNKK